MEYTIKPSMVYKTVGAKDAIQRLLDHGWIIKDFTTPKTKDWYITVPYGSDLHRAQPYFGGKWPSDEPRFIVEPANKQPPDWWS